MPRIFRNGRDYSGSSAQIDDNTAANNKVYSSAKTEEIANTKQNILNVETGTITPSSGVTITNASLRRYGKVVSLAMTVSISSPTRWQGIATITSDFQPDSDNVYGVMSNTSSTTGVQTAHVNVYSNRVRLGNTLPDANAAYSFCLTWILP